MTLRHQEQEDSGLDVMTARDTDLTLIFSSLEDVYHCPQRLAYYNNG